MNKINVKTICIFHNRGKILVAKIEDKNLNQICYRPLGGHIEFGETSREAITREIKEELQTDIANLQLIGTLENFFTFEGNPGHEIIQVYDAGFIDKSMYLIPEIKFTESNRQECLAIWRSIDSFTDSSPLVPVGLLALIKSIY